MTLLSVVLPVHGVQAYLAQCLDSLLDQSFTDLEVIAVDDCSPDNSGAILAEYAARDPRVTVVTLPASVGPGPARNAGLDVATGEYVWFVDSDDWAAEHALAGIARRLRDTGADVLMLGYDRVHWDGRVEPGSQTVAEAPESFTADEFPKILNVLHVAWNKVVRRELLVASGYRFEPGWYEDLTFTYLMLLSADRISALPRVCVHYRQRRTGNITRTADDRHFEVFGHWASTLALADRHAERGAALRPLLVRRMIWHYLVLLGNRQRLLPGSRRRFFERMHESYRQHVPAGGYPLPKGGQGVRHRLVASGNYPGYRAYDVVARVKNGLIGAARRAKQGARRTAGRARQGVYRLYYRGQLLLPVDRQLALYAAYWYRGVFCNPAAIAEAAGRLAPEVRAVWVVKRGNTAAVPPGVEHVVAGSLRYYRMLARAHWLVNNVNWPQWVQKRPGSVHVMTHHGTPLKRMGLHQMDHPAAATDKGFVAQMARVDRWDFSISANPHTTIAWQGAYPAQHETLEVGYPRNDRLVVSTQDDIAEIRERLSLRPDERVVLYAPTHREWHRPGASVLDVEDLAERLGRGTVLLVRAHYFNTGSQGDRTPERSGRIVDVSAYPVVEDLYLAADLMITDYSSAMFDYAVLDRPIVIFAPDWAVYREVRGVYFDLLAEPPGAVASTYPELLDILDNQSYSDEESISARKEFRRRFCSLEDGGAAERVVRSVFLL